MALYQLILSPSSTILKHGLTALEVQYTRRRDPSATQLLGVVQAKEASGVAGRLIEREQTRRLDPVEAAATAFAFTPAGGGSWHKHTDLWANH